MAKRMTPGEIIRAGVRIGAIPEYAIIDRKGRAVWDSGELSQAAMVYGGREGTLVWRTFVGDAKLGPAMSRFGSLMVGIDAASGDSIAWPESAKASTLLGEFLTNGIGASKNFIIGRRDLASVLASEFDIERGALKTWLPHSSYPARLVQALVVARDDGAKDLEELIQAQLQSGVQILQDGQSVDILATARRWARQYEKALGFAIQF